MDFSVITLLIINFYWVENKFGFCMILIKLIITKPLLLYCKNVEVAHTIMMISTSAVLYIIPINEVCTFDVLVYNCHSSNMSTNNQWRF